MKNKLKVHGLLILIIVASLVLSGCGIQYVDLSDVPGTNGTFYFTYADTEPSAGVDPVDFQKSAYYKSICGRAGLIWERSYFKTTDGWYQIAKITNDGVIKTKKVTSENLDEYEFVGKYGPLDGAVFTLICGG